MTHALQRARQVEAAKATTTERVERPLVEHIIWTRDDVKPIFEQAREQGYEIKWSR